MNARLFRLAVIWLLAILTVWAVEPYFVAAWWAARTPRPVTARGNLAQLEQATIALFKLASPSVVHVFARSARQPRFSPSGEAVVQTGSGVVWDEAGDIVTNNHVIAGGTQLGVR